MTDKSTIHATQTGSPFQGQRVQIQPLVDLVIDNESIAISYRFLAPDGIDNIQTVHGAGDEDTTPPVFEVGISGAGFFSQSGKPLLPSFGRFVQIPPDVDFDIAHKAYDRQVFTGYRIKPAQENATDQEEDTFEFDEAAYRQDDFYPADVLDWSGPYYLDGYRVICLHVRPLQYNPKQKLLHFHRRIDVTVKLLPRVPAAEGEDEDGKTGPAASVFSPGAGGLEGFGNFLFNPDRRCFYNASTGPSRPAPASESPGPPSFLVVYGEGLGEPAKKLQAWKRRRGLETGVVSTGEIYPPGTDDTEKIDRLKTYLRGLRQVAGSPLRYVLLLGDVGRIPVENVGNFKTDHYYFTHRDARDRECLLPWISGGRIPVDNRQAAMAVVEKIINYEKDPPHDPDYYNRMTFAAYFQDSDRNGRQDGVADMAYVHTMERIREHLVARGVVVNRVYVSNTKDPRYYSDGSPVPMAVKAVMINTEQGRIATKRLISQINQGQLLVGHRGHGSKLGWREPRFKTGELKTLANDFPSVFFSINCLTGSFQRKKDTFAEEILKSEGTAPSLIAATANSGSWRNDSMVKALFDAIWPGIIRTVPPAAGFPVKYHRMGDLLNYAKAYLLVSHDVNDMTKKQIEIYHVIGDPTLELWGEAPAPLGLHTQILKEKLLINMTTCPKDAVLSVWYGGKRLMRKEPAVARMALPLSLFEALPDDALDSDRDTPYAIDVCLYAPGHRFVSSRLWF